MAFGLTAYRVGHADGTRSMANDQVPGDAAQGKNTHLISQDRIVMLTTFVSYNPVSSGNAHASAANPGLAVQDPGAAPSGPRRSGCGRRRSRRRHGRFLQVASKNVGWFQESCALLS